MKHLTAKELRERLALLPDDTKIAIQQKTNDGCSLYFDIKHTARKLKGIGPVLYLHSQGLDLTIEADKEMIKEEAEPW